MSLWFREESGQPSGGDRVPHSFPLPGKESPLEKPSLTPGEPRPCCFSTHPHGRMSPTESLQLLGAAGLDFVLPGS